VTLVWWAPALWVEIMLLGADGSSSVLYGLCFDLLPFCQDCRAAPEVDVGRCQAAKALVAAVVVVVRD
jgi:hypothetical protein